MPVREWLWHATSVRHDHGQGTCQRALKHGWDHRSLHGKAPFCYHSALRQRLWRRAWCRGALHTASLFLPLILILMVGRLYAQAPPSSDKPAPAVPGPVETVPTPQERPPTLVPAVPGPVETVPTPQERLLAPVPQQFNWLTRQVPSNALLEALLGLQRPGNLTVSASLTEEVSDNFEHASLFESSQPGRGRAPSRTTLQSPSDRRIDSRTGLTLGTVYRLDDGQKFVSLANTVQAFYETVTDRTRVGFANLALNAGYQLPPWSFGLSDSFVRGDNTVPEATVPFLRTRQNFIRNSVTPQVRYDITRSTTASLSYTNTLVVHENGTQDTIISHAVASSLQYRLSRNLAGSTQYTFRTSDGTELATLVVDETGIQDNAASHAVTSGLQYQLSRNLAGSTQYTFRTSDGAASAGGHAHLIATDLGYNYTIDPITSANFRVFGTLIEQSTSAGRLSRIYGASIGAQRLLFSTAILFVSVGPTVFKRQGEPERVRASWSVSLDGPIPLFATPSLSLTLTTRQSVEDSFGEVNDVGLVLRQLVGVRLNYTPAASYTAALFADYSRSELLEDVSTVGAVQGRREMIWSTGATAAYALTRLISLTAIYRYQRRDSDLPGNAFDENRLTIAVTGTFPVF